MSTNDYKICTKILTSTDNYLFALLEFFTTEALRGK